LARRSNSLEEVEAGLITSLENVYTEYPDPRRDERQNLTYIKEKYGYRGL